MRRLFLVWNRSYKTQMVVAKDADEALRISMNAGHFKRLDRYRRWEDCTDEHLAREEMPGLAAALAAEKSGVATYSVDGWSIDGELIAS